MAAEGVDPGAERWARYRDRALERGHGSGLLGTGLRPDHVCCAGVAPDCQVGGRVAHVFVAVSVTIPAEFLLQESGFVRSFEIDVSIAAMHFVDESNIAGNRLGQILVD